MRQRKTIISMAVDIIDFDSMKKRVDKWLNDSKGRYVCVSNVHMCMESYHKPDFNRIVNDADTVIADGRPIYWAQRLLGADQASQIRGLDLTLGLCRWAETKQVNVGFYGGTPEVLNQLQVMLKQQFPALPIVYAYSPPFNALNDQEVVSIQNSINQQRVQLLFVGLGCPKQEIWMADNKERLNCVMFGVGAVFDFIAGHKKQAPEWLQKAGLEWLFRLLQEPRRLWYRYLTTNPKFIALLFGQRLRQLFNTR